VLDLTERLVQGRSLHEEIVDILREMVLERRLSLGSALLSSIFTAAVSQGR
jgi:hypothetical protein